MTFLYLNSDKIGTGDPTQGKKLLALFLDKLSKSDQQVDMIGCLNEAVYLTTEESWALPSLKKLEAKGARIASCHTCLDDMGLMDKVVIGETGNMTTTIEVMFQADKVISPC